MRYGSIQQKRLTACDQPLLVSEVMVDIADTGSATGAYIQNRGRFQSLLIKTGQCGHQDVALELGASPWKLAFQYFLCCQGGGPWARR